MNPDERCAHSQCRSRRQKDSEYCWRHRTEATAPQQVEVEPGAPIDGFTVLSALMLARQLKARKP